MKDYNYKKLRNVGLIGHGATGKTSLAEALLFYTNNTDRLGKIEEGNTVMDYEQEEKRRGISLSTSVASFEENDTKINIVEEKNIDANSETSKKDLEKEATIDIIEPIETKELNQNPNETKVDNEEKKD